MRDIYLLSESHLEALFEIKYGKPETVGWSPRQRQSFGFYSASDTYEAHVANLVTNTTTWVDIGGGSSLFPDNVGLAEKLSNRCERLVVVDPSENVRDNKFCDEYSISLFEHYETQEKFDLATFRMVAEHVTEPDLVLSKLASLMKTGGLVVIYTVNKHCPIPIITRYTPFFIHYPIKKLLWGGEEKDTFPVAYRMNTRKSLSSMFKKHGFSEDHFSYVDDLSTFAKFKSLSYMELLLWKLLNRVGFSYLENNLLGIYKKTEELGAIR